MVVSPEPFLAMRAQIPGDFASLLSSQAAKSSGVLKDRIGFGESRNNGCAFFACAFLDWAFVRAAGRRFVASFFFARLPGTLYFATTRLGKFASDAAIKRRFRRFFLLVQTE